MSQELNNRDKQASQANGSKAVCKCALGGATGGVLGEVVGAEVPGTVDASDDGVDGVLEPLGDPVHGKSNKGDQTNDLALATAATSTRWVVVGWLILVVNGDERDGVPGAKCSCNHSTNEADEIRMAVFLADVDSCLQHQCREGNPRNPCIETKGHEETKDQEDDAGGIVLPPQIEDSRANCPADVENTRHPDELLGKEARKPDVGVGENDGDGEAEGEEDHGTRIEREIVAIVVDSGAICTAMRGIALEGEARDCDEASKDENKLCASIYG